LNDTRQIVAGSIHCGIVEKQLPPSSKYRDGLALSKYRDGLALMLY
jgi:hypothetical protein